MRRFFKRLVGFGLLALIVGIAAFALAVVFTPIPEPNDFALAQTSTVTYSDGTTTIAALGDVTRTSVPLTDVPEPVRQAVLAAEDRDFYAHDGFSPTGITRAMINNVTGGETAGGSTITQQYVKNAYLTQDQTIVRKAKELILSVKLESLESKSNILEDYLNTIYFGRGAYGIEAASQAYFGHPAAELTQAEGVALAAVIQSPTNFEPETHLEALQSRFDYVANGMVERNWLTAADAAALTMPAFVPIDPSNKFGGQNGYIVQEVRQELLAAGLTDAQIDSGGLHITTTIDPAAQADLVAAVEQEAPSTGTEGLRIGAASVDPKTGGILAMYGGPDYVASPLNNATQATAQAGSTFKAFALAAAFEDDISLYSRWNGNSPATIDGYTLSNEGNKDYGHITLKRATEQSVNTAFVDLTSQVGVDKVINAAYRAGIPRDTAGIEPNLTFVLGSASPSPVDMASAYATFAARGYYHKPHFVAVVTDADGQQLYDGTVPSERRFDEDVADQVNAALQNVVTNGTASKAKSIGRDVAGKTGTTDENKSAWFVGYAPQAATAVMLMKEDANGNPITLRGTGGMSKVFGSSFPLNIWVAHNKAYLKDLPVEEFVQPKNTSSRSNGGSTNWRRTPYATPSQSQPPSPTPTPSETAPETAEPQPPVDPVEPVDPVDPVDPVKPVDPVNPVKPVNGAGSAAA